VKLLHHLAIPGILVVASLGLHGCAYRYTSYRPVAASVKAEGIAVIYDKKKGYDADWDLDGTALVNTEVKYFCVYFPMPPGQSGGVLCPARADLLGQARGRHVPEDIFGQRKSEPDVRSLFRMAGVGYTETVRDIAWRGQTASGRTSPEAPAAWGPIEAKMPDLHAIAWQSDGVETWFLARPWGGKRSAVINEAMTRTYLSEVIDVGIGDFWDIKRAVVIVFNTYGSGISCPERYGKYDTVRYWYYKENRLEDYQLDNLRTRRLIKELEERNAQVPVYAPGMDHSLYHWKPVLGSELAP
jgi:hypothetical protein